MPPFLAAAWLIGAALTNPIQITPRSLFDGLEARKVILEDHDSQIALDPRVFRYGNERQGVVVTDPIDLGQRDGIVALEAKIENVAVSVSATVPPGTAIEVETRSGSNRYSESEWSAWKPLGSLERTVRPLAGRYLQLRFLFRGQSPENRPSVAGVALRPLTITSAPWKGKLRVVKQDSPSMVRSPLLFHYERPDNSKLVQFRQKAKLDSVVAGSGDDFEKLVRLMDWVGAGTNVRGFGWDQGSGTKAYPWDTDRLLEVSSEGKLTVKGHCMSYAVALISAATALGYHARHWAIEGFRDMDHEVVEIWTPSRKKWIYFDPSLTSYYYDERTKEPLNVLELHRLVVKRFLRPGEDMNWWHQDGKGSLATKARVREVGGKAGIGCRVGPWAYGRPMAGDYDWGWNHGYLACGFMQLTPRNDFHSHPEATAKDFAGARRFTADDYPLWVDQQTPPLDERAGCANNWYTRERDMYWTPDASIIDLATDAEGVLRVEFGHSMPFFRRFRVKVDGALAMESRSPYLWRLHEGNNRLAIVPEDVYGKVGAESAVEVEYDGTGTR